MPGEPSTPAPAGVTLAQAEAMAAASSEKSAGKPDSPKQLLLGLLFGLAFGFLLQKGGVAKFEVLIGALLLSDFTVMKIMLTAIVVGMVGIFGLHALGLVKLHVKPTRYAANILGGLLFGAGFALIGYCPGTGAAALGQGNYDAIAGVLGLVAGSHLYAESSAALKSSVLAWGQRGGIMLPDLVRLPLGVFLAGFVPFLLAALWAIERWAP